MQPNHFLLVLCLAASAILSASAQPRISEDRDLIDIDVSAWDCLNQPGGSAKTPDGVERNAGKNRSPVALTGLRVPEFDTAEFLKHIATFDSATKGKRRKDLAAPEKTQLEELEKEIVSFTGYLVLAYAGPPESTNCASVDMHDWHLEVFEKPADHPPRPGDPTPIICEITPRTQRGIFRDNIRLLNLAGFMRRPDLSYEPTGHAASLVKLTGFLLWDDEHNGRFDIGTTIEAVGRNGYHHPWRSTAWEMHPVLKIEAVDGAAPTADRPVNPTSAATPVASAAPTIASVPAVPQTVTITAPVKIKIPYGETILPRGMKVELLARDAQTATVRYLGNTVRVPRAMTDLPAADGP